LGTGERFIALALQLIVAGCQMSKQAEQLSNPPKSTPETKPAKSSTAPQSQQVTPQSIAKELFPGAPEKTGNLECFRSLRPEMSVYAVVQKCGRPDEEVGSGLYVLVYHLQDGSSVMISTPDLNKLHYLSATDAQGEESVVIGHQ
jgi:hypothetical protein